MDWSVSLILYWCNHYYQLRDFELNPFEEIRVFWGDLCKSGSLPHLGPQEETFEMNWEFDKALKGLEGKEAEFRRLYLNGEGESIQLFEQFCRLLMKENNR